MGYDEVQFVKFKAVTAVGWSVVVFTNDSFTLGLLVEFQSDAFGTRHDSKTTQKIIIYLT